MMYGKVYVIMLIKIKWEVGFGLNIQSHIYNNSQLHKIDTKNYIQKVRYILLNRSLLSTYYLLGAS